MQFSDGQQFGDSAGAGTGQDLRSQAVLDALGLLDEVESAQFERAFRDALPSVQAEVRSLQAEVSADPAFLSSVEGPSPDLKARTLARVMTEVERHEAQLAPIAHIGRTGGRPGRRSVGSIDAQDLMQQAMELAVLRSDVRRVSRNSYAWRAATFALAAGLVASLIFQVSVQGLAARITELALGTSTVREINESLGHPGLAGAVQAASFRRSISAPEGARGGMLVLLVDDAAEGAFGFLLGTGPGTFTLHWEDGDGTSRQLATLNAVSDPWGIRFALAGSGVSPQDLRSGQLVLRDASGTEVMRG